MEIICALSDCMKYKIIFSNQFPGPSKQFYGWVKCIKPFYEWFFFSQLHVKLILFVYLSKCVFHVFIYR